MADLRLAPDVLSAGNPNTVALTLLLALHLSTKPQLPWLVIDDPVQSMDEVHISQFAALLRTLAKQHDRQIIVAVHEKPLFDYLALESSPSFDGDRLITIELARAANGNSLATPQIVSWELDTAVAAYRVGRRTLSLKKQTPSEPNFEKALGRFEHGVRISSFAAIACAPAALA